MIILFILDNTLSIVSRYILFVVTSLATEYSSYIDKNLEVVERYQGIRNVHEPLFMDDQIIAVARKLGLITRGHQHLSSKKESTILLRYVENGYRFLRTNELISDDNILLTDTTHLLIFNLNMKKIIWKIKLDGFGDQKIKIGKKYRFQMKADVSDIT